MSVDRETKWLELVADGRAEWVPGMRAIDSDGQAARVVQATGAAVLEDVGGAAYPMRSTPPDWSDPATLGALVGQVEARHGEPVSVWWSRGGRCHVATESLMRAGDHWGGVTKAGALLVALGAP